MSAWRVLAACALVLGGAAASQGTAPAKREMGWRETTWRETTWPFPLDPWPAGRAFLCSGASCVRAVRLTIRPKLGFCNCTTGVADDEEIDRVTDLAALSDRFTPAGAGWPVAIGPFAGRARRYALGPQGGRPRFALALAVSRRCDVVVALVDGDAPIDEAATRSALDLLSGGSVVTWMLRSLGDA